MTLFYGPQTSPFWGTWIVRTLILVKYSSFFGAMGAHSYGPSIITLCLQPVLWLMWILHSWGKRRSKYWATTVVLNFLWTPPPAAIESCLGELWKARHKHQDSTHIILLPRLMPPPWRRHLNKVCFWTASSWKAECLGGRGDVWTTNNWSCFTISSFVQVLAS